MQQSWLCQLYILWEPKLRPLPQQYNMPEQWGPSQAQLLIALNFEYNAQLEEDNKDEDEVEDIEEDFVNDDLMEAIEMSSFSDVYRSSSWMDGLIWQDDTDFTAEPLFQSMLLSGPSERSQSPRKRGRKEA